MPRKGSAGPGSFGIDVTRVLKGALIQKKIPQVAVTRHCVISPSQVSRILSFEKEMTLDQYEGFCMAAGMDVVEVMDLASDQSVWGDRTEHYVNGILIAESPLSDSEAYELRCQEGEASADIYRIATSTPDVSPVEDDDDALIDRINAGTEQIAAQKRTDPLDEHYT